MCATLEEEIAHSPQVEWPARCSEEVAELDDVVGIVHVKASSRVELCLEENSLFLYGRSKPAVAKAKGGGSKKRKLLS